MTSPRRFHLVRTQDITGTSGTGKVAEGVQTSSGKMLMEWTCEPATSVCVYASVEDLLKIHGHEGATTIEWLDTEFEVVECPNVLFDGRFDADPATGEHDKREDRHGFVYCGWCYDHDPAAQFEGPPRQEWPCPWAPRLTLSPYEKALVMARLDNETLTAWYWEAASAGDTNLAKNAKALLNERGIYV